MTSTPAPFPVNQLVAGEGVLEASIRWGEAEGDDPLLLHAITVHLGSLSLGGGVEDTAPKLRLHSIRFPVSSWTQLQGRAYRFPNLVRCVVADGESDPIYDIYGSLKIGDRYHEVVPSLLRFDPDTGCTLGVHLDAEINPTDTPPSFASTAFTLDAELTVAVVRVVGDAASPDYPSLTEASELSRQLLDLNRYAAPVVKDGCVTFAPRCAGGRPATSLKKPAVGP
ncbi:MAG: hypothetical protein ACRDQ5_02195 [Sciscionella sp.]